MKNKSSFATLAIALCCALSSARGQGDIGPALFTVGTTTNVSGNSHAYLLWQFNDDSLLAADKSFAVYKKTGSKASAAAFQRITITSVHENPNVIAPLLVRSEKVGQDLVELGHRVDAMFASFLPSGDFSLAERLAAVIHGSLQDPQMQRNLGALARQYPAAALALGQAWVEPIQATTTFEVREWDSTAQRDLAVVGRITLKPDSPNVLPAPGAPFQLTEFSQKGHLNVKMRWSTPDTLRRMALLSRGFNLYRLDRELAENEGLTLAAPSRSRLSELLENHPGARLVNRIPIVTSRYMNQMEASDPQDVETWFAADDNDRFENGNAPFENGTAYYYYVSAVDVLGRPGRISQGTPVIVCDRMAPLPPTDIEVKNDVVFANGAVDARLMVQWEITEEDEDKESGNLEYHLYRWSSIQEMTELQNMIDGNGVPMLNRIHVEPHVPGKTSYSFRDQGASAPNLSSNAGETFWYTIRIKDGSACGGNFSHNSSPRFGVLRERKGPDAATGVVLGSRCFVPKVEFLQSTKESFVEPIQDKEYFELVCTYPGSVPPDYADFYVSSPNNAPPEFIARVPFTTQPGYGPAALLVHAFESEDIIEPKFYCQVMMNGQYSGVVSGAPQVSGVRDGQKCVMHWEATVVASNDVESCGDTWDPVDRESETVVGPRGVFVTSEGTREYKIYRRLGYSGDANLTLIIQGTTETDDPTAIAWEDPSPPNTTTRICYFVKLFDVHGNAGPLTPLGCVHLVNWRYLPVPMLAQIEAVGTADEPQMRIRWFCSPYGVTRFELLITPNIGAMSEDLLGNLASLPGQGKIAQQVNPALQPVSYLDWWLNSKGIYETKRVTAESGAEFSYTVPAKLGQTYKIFVRAVGPGDYGSRAQGKLSNREFFTWQLQDETPGPNVRWPARPLPDIGDFGQLGAVRAVYLDFDGTSEVKGPAVRIGETSTEAEGAEEPEPGFQTYQIHQSDKDPMRHVFTEGAVTSGRVPGYENSIMPCVLYRYQVPSTTLPQVSGDIVQVSPMMEQIAYSIVTDTQGSHVSIRDPYIALIHYLYTRCDNTQNPCPPLEAGETHGLFLRDSQPVIRGATYKYLLVRFRGDKEIDRVIDCGNVTIPTTP